MHATLATLRRPFVALFAAALLFAPTAATLAQEGERTLQPRGLGATTLQEAAGRFAQVLIGISGSVALLVFVYGGFLWLTSAGDAQRVDKGKKALTWAVIGLGVIFGAYAILNVVFGAFTA